MRRWGYRRRSEVIGSRYNESSLVDAMLQTANLMPGTFAWRMETDGKVRQKKDGSFFVVRNKGGRGKPDICGVTAGRGWVVEAKMPGQQAQLHQIEWMQDYVSRGHGVAGVCHSVEEIEAFVGKFTTPGAEICQDPKPTSGN